MGRRAHGFASRHLCRRTRTSQAAFLTPSSASVRILLAIWTLEAFWNSPPWGVYPSVMPPRCSPNSASSLFSCSCRLSSVGRQARTHDGRWSALHQVGPRNGHCLHESIGNNASTFAGSIECDHTQVHMNAVILAVGRHQEMQWRICDKSAGVTTGGPTFRGSARASI